MLLWGDLARAQSTTAESTAGQPSLALSPPAQSVTPTAAQGLWWTPPPLAPGATWRGPRARATPPVDTSVVPRNPDEFVSSEQRCEDTQFLGRIAAETLSATAGVAGTVMITAFMVNSSNNWGTALLTFTVGVASYLLLPPLAVHGVGRNFGGNGKIWAALVGGLLLPVVGHVIGYELSHTTECEPGARTAHPRRAPSLASSLEDRAPRWAPAIAPTGQGGAIMAVTVAF